MAVGLYDPVPTGVMEMLDRRLPPSVVSAFQINAADERRGLFPVDRIVPAGLSDDGRFLSVDVAGVHSDIGGSYLRGGLGVRSFNLMTDYRNALYSEPLHQDGSLLCKHMGLKSVMPRCSLAHDSRRGLRDRTA